VTELFRAGSWPLAAVAALAAPALAFAQPADPAPPPPAAAAQPAAPQTHPVEALAELPFLTSPLLSPDGTRIAGRVTVDGNEVIGVWNLADPRDRPPALIEAGNVDSFSWAGDNRLVIGVTSLVVFTLGRASLPVPVRRVMSHDLSSGKTETLGNSSGFLDELVFVDPAGRYVLLSMQVELDRSPSVHRIDLATGESVEVQPSRSGVWSWFADADGVVRVGVDYGERRTKIYYRPAAGADLRLLETRRNLLDDSVVDMVRFISNTERGLIVTNAETGRFAVYEYDFATDTRGAVLFEHPQVDVTTTIFGADGSVDGVFYEDDRPRVRWLNPTLERLQQRIDRTFPGKTNVIVNRSRDGNRVLIFSSAPDDPGTYYVFDQAARRMEIFASPYDRLQGRSFAPVRPVSYPSRDGLAIHGYLTLPAGQGESALPLVVLPHGGPFLRDSWQFDPQVQFLASRGYAVLQPNFRGSTGYGRDFVERGYGQLGAGMIDDIDDGVDWLARQGIVDPSRVCIMGSSYGGYAAIWAAMRSPNRYRCAISWAGPTDLERMLRYDRRYIIPNRYMSERRRQIEGATRTDLDQYSPLRQAQRLSVPVLIGHGEQDIRVPVDQSRDLVRALTRRRADVESIFYPKSGHNFTTPEESVDFMRRIEAFLARHNPAGDSHFQAPSVQNSPQTALK
jgi:dipeptidyl aminopeptidase/acylaminoacyl peptidase